MAKINTFKKHSFTRKTASTNAGRASVIAMGVSIKNKIYVICGRKYISEYNDEASHSSNLDIYDTVSDSWKNTQYSVHPRQYAAMCAIGTKIHVMFGTDSSNRNSYYHSSYDTVTETYKELTQISYYGGTKRGLFSVGNLLYSMDGSNIDIYDTLTETWSTKVNPDTETRDSYRQQIYTTIGNDVFIVCGGNKTIAKYTPSLNTCKTEAYLPIKISYNSSANIGKNIYMMNGYEDSNTSSTTTKLETNKFIYVYDTVAGKLSKKFYEEVTPLAKLAITNNDVIYLMYYSYTGSSIYAFEDGKEVTLTVPDETPKFNYKGKHHFKIKNDEKFTPPNVTAIDSKGNVTVTSSGTVGETAGVYEIKYTAGDAEMYITVERIIEQTTEPEPPETKPMEVWEKLAEANIARSKAALGKVGSNIYAIGGDGENYKAVDVNECYNTTSDTWSIKTALEDTLNTHSAASIMFDVYILGGYGKDTSTTSSTKNRKYDSLSDTWTIKKEIPVSSQYHNSETISGKIYLFGSNKTSTDTNHVYDPTTNTWSEKAKRDVHISYATSQVTVCDIYTFSGYKVSYSNGNIDLTNVKSIYVYDSINNLWKTKKDMADNVTEGSAAMLNDIIYIFGHGQVLKYNYKDETWHKAVKPTDLASGESTITVNDYVYVICGGTNPKVKRCYRFNIQDVPVEPEKPVDPPIDPPNPPDEGESNENIERIKKEIETIKQLIMLSL